MTLAVGLVCASSAGFAQTPTLAPDPCFELLQVEGSVNCLLGNEGSFTTKVKVTNRCDHTIRFVVAISHESGPSKMEERGWDVVHQQTFEPVALRMGASKEFESTSPEHPEKAWYRFIATISNPNGGSVKELSLGGTQRVCYPVDPTIFEFVPPLPPTLAPIRTTPTAPIQLNRPTPLPTSTLNDTSESSDSLSSLSSTLIGVTWDTLFPFFAPFLLGGLLVTIDTGVSYRRTLKRRDHGRIWWTWLVVMVSGGIALVVATMIGLLGVAIGSVLAAVLKGDELSSVSEQQGSLLHYLTFLLITALAGATAGSIAGLVQWIILRPVSNQQLGACVRYNTMCWPISLASSLVLSLIFVVCGSFFRLDTPMVSIIASMGAGAVAGCMITHRLMQPTLSLSLWGREDN